MKRSRWASSFNILIVSLGLVGCGQTLENALASDPQTETWTGESPDKPASESTQSTQRPSPQDANGAQLDAQVRQTTPSAFADIAEAPSHFQAYIEDLARLEILNPRG